MATQPQHPLVTSLLRALDRFEVGSHRVLEQLIAPYRARAAREGRSALGPPLKLELGWDAAGLATLANGLRGMARDCSAVESLARDEAALTSLVRDYRAGRFDVNATGAWLADIEMFRQQVDRHLADARREADSLGPLARPKRSPARPTASGGSMTAEILTPELAVPLMGGMLGEAGLRARIRKGQAGPWRRAGGKWQIGRDEFLAWHVSVL